MKNMSGRVALVTGASRGIGAAIANRFKDGGAHVLTPSRQECDLAHPTSIEAFCASLQGPVEILVNCAGINKLASLDELEESDFTDTLQINLQAPLQLIRHLGPSMKNRGWGRILNISSIWGTISKPRRITYSASKAGLEGLTRAVALEFAPYQVLVNALAPGFIDTEMTRQNNPQAILDQIREEIPLKRLAQSEEIAELAFFLCSETNSYITGQVIIADGGFVCK